MRATTNVYIRLHLRGKDGVFHHPRRSIIVIQHDISKSTTLGEIYHEREDLMKAVMEDNPGLRNLEFDYDTTIKM